MKTINHVAYIVNSFSATLPPVSQSKKKKKVPQIIISGDGGTFIYKIYL